MRAPTIFALTLLMFCLASVGAPTYAQDAPVPSTLSLYIEENGRLKQQKAALQAENETLKQTLQTEQEKATRLQTSLDQMQPAVNERDRQISELTASLQYTNQAVARWQLLAALLAWMVVMFLAGIVIYSQRVYLRKQFRKLMERHTKSSDQGRTPRQLVRPTSAFDTNVIRPEELVDRLYGRH
ncbi:MAG: hypothetical protein AB1489_16365 [Acidobacteriota bacterium]